MLDPVPALSARRLPGLRRALFTWFKRHRRDLPWRLNADPYRIWVSEIMLQQTTVAAVVPYFNRFLIAFPTVTALAAADEQTVLNHWSGLGYYRRARFLHAAAKQLAAAYGNDLPDDPAVWEALPGIGRYTLGAVMSQAFDRRFPILEANTFRVLSRWFALEGDPRSGVGQKRLWQLAEYVLPKTNCGTFNQAMMELGSLVCTPTDPQCGACPVAGWCEANRLGKQREIPPKPVKPAKIDVREVALVLMHRGERILLQRPADAKRWAGFWECPHGELQPGEPVDAAARRIAREQLGIAVTVGREFAVIRHGITRYAITMTCLEATTNDDPQPQTHAAVHRLPPDDDGSAVPMASPQRKLLALLKTYQPTFDFPAS